MQVGAFQHDHEFLAADAVETIGHADAQVDDLGDALQDLVADSMAVDIVDLLEVIEV